MPNKEKQKIELTVGKKKIRDIAEWRGIKINTFSHNREKYLNELKSFAVFHEEGKGIIIIDEVLEPIYTKAKSELYQKVSKEVPKRWHFNQPETCKRVADEIYDSQMEKLGLSEDDMPWSRGTVNQYVLADKKERYGKTGQAPGRQGYCHYCWGIPDKEKGYRYLTEEEEEIKNDIFIKYYNGISEDMVFTAMAFKDKELNRKEFVESVNGLTERISKVYHHYSKAFKDKTGFQLIRCTCAILTSIEEEEEE